MNNKTLVILLVVAVAAARLLPHPYNFTPIGAFALFSGAYITDWRLLAAPLAALFIGDAVTGFYAAVVMIFVYLGFAGATLTGRLLLLKRRSAPRFIAALLAGATVFYLLSNIGMWQFSYPRTLSGLLACWTDGLPFLLRSVVGDFLYGAVMFGIVEGYRRRRIHGYAAG